MPDIAIITDTDASLPDPVCEQYGIRQVPITVNFGSEVLRTGIDIDDAGLFARIDREGTMPTTSAPAPGDFSTAFEEAFKSGANTVLCLCVSSEVSATYGAAVLARQALPERDIHVVDTLNLTMGQGFMVLAAAEAAQEGKPVLEILNIVEQVRERSHMYAVLPTLKYLAMSGRVGSLAAGFADVISIKPILTVRDGKLRAVGAGAHVKESLAKGNRVVRRGRWNQPGRANGDRACKRGIRSDRILQPIE